MNPPRLPAKAVLWWCRFTASAISHPALPPSQRRVDKFGQVSICATASLIRFCGFGGNGAWLWCCLWSLFETTQFWHMLMRLLGYIGIAYTSMPVQKHHLNLGPLQRHHDLPGFQMRFISTRMFVSYSLRRHSTQVCMSSPAKLFSRMMHSLSLMIWFLPKPPEESGRFMTILNLQNCEENHVERHVEILARRRRNAEALPLSLQSEAVSTGAWLCLVPHGAWHWQKWLKWLKCLTSWNVLERLGMSWNFSVLSRVSSMQGSAAGYVMSINVSCNSVFKGWEHQSSALTRH